MAKIISILTILGFAFGAFLYLDARYAKCQEVKAIERRLDYKIENDKLMGVQQRLWQIQEKYPTAMTTPLPVQQQTKELEADLEMQKDKVKRMEAK